MKAILILVTFLVAAPAFADQSISTRKPIVVADLCIKIGEETSGAYKFCRYNCPGGLYEMEIKPSERCPASIDH